MTDATEERFAATRAFHKQFLLTDPFRRYGAHAVGVGWKVVAGTATRQPALRFYVSHKVPDEALPAERRVPRELTWSGTGVQGTTTIVTDVIESQPARVLMEDPESKIRPVPGGVSVSAQGTGTMGAWVWDTLDDSIVMLSNAHVFGYTPGEPIIQPADSDLGSPTTDRIGEVKRSVDVDPVQGPSPWPLEQCNFVDAAIGSADSSDLIDLTVLEVGPAVYATQPVAMDMPVEISGKSTGHTNGIVVDCDYAAAYNTPIGVGNWQMVAYCELFVVEPTDPGSNIAIDGDSGSVVFTPDPDSPINPAVGLLAWGDGGSHAIACRIQNVFEELRVDVLCAGGFEAFLDALAEDGKDFEAALAVSLFEPKRPRPHRALRFHNGLARDVQLRLRDSEVGRSIVEFVDAHRAELLSMLLRNGDVRRSVAAALRPMLRGVTTTDRLFSHVLSATNIEQAELALDVAARTASKALASDIRDLRERVDLKARCGESIRAVIEDYAE